MTLTGRGTGHGPVHTGCAHGYNHKLLAAARMGFRPDSPRPRGLQRILAAQGPPPPPAAPSAPTREALLQSHLSSTLDAKAAVSAESRKTLWIRNSCSSFWIYVRGTRCRIQNGVFQNNFPCSAKKHCFSCAFLRRHLQGDPVFLRPTTLPFVSKVHHTSLPGKEMCFVLPRMDVPGCGSANPLEALVKES